MPSTQPMPAATCSGVTFNFVLISGSAPEGDAGFEEEVDPLQAVLVVVGAFAGAHALRFLVKRWMADRGDDDAR